MCVEEGKEERDARSRARAHLRQSGAVAQVHSLGELVADLLEGRVRPLSEPVHNAVRAAVRAAPSRAWREKSATNHLLNSAGDVAERLSKSSLDGFMVKTTCRLRCTAAQKRWYSSSSESMVRPSLFRGHVRRLRPHTTARTHLRAASLHSAMRFL